MPSCKLLYPYQNIDSMSTISIENMDFYAFHGCFDEESKIGTHFRVDLLLEVNTEVAQKSDNIDDTLNYLEVYQTVKVQMMIASHLLEHVADRIGEALLLRFPAINSLTVKVSKMNPPLGGHIGAVALAIEKRRGV